MISYELAKQLKDAGFAQTIGFFFYENCPEKSSELVISDIRWHDDWTGEWGEGHLLKNQIITLCPTLSELIEACGNGFVKLERYEDKFFCYSGYEPATDDCKGSTPDEAVAQLWLQLNKS